MKHLKLIISISACILFFNALIFAASKTEEEQLYEKHTSDMAKGMFEYMGFHSLPKDDVNSLAPINWEVQLAKYGFNLSHNDSSLVISWKDIVFDGSYDITTYSSMTEAQLELASCLGHIPVRLDKGAFNNVSVGDTSFHGTSNILFVRKNFLVKVDFDSRKKSPAIVAQANHLADTIDKIILSSTNLLKEPSPYQVTISSKDFKINEQISITVSPNDNRLFTVRSEIIKGPALSGQSWTISDGETKHPQTLTLQARQPGNGVIKIYVCQTSGMVWTYYLDFNILESDYQNDINIKFIEAVYNGDVEKVKAFLIDVADVNKKSPYRTALILAAERGHTEVVKVLLDAKADVNVQDKHDGTTALMIAARAGHTEIVKVLVDAGADVNMQETISGETALNLAACNRNVDAIKVLLAAKADVNIKNYKGHTAIWFALLKGDTDTVNLLKQYGAKECDIQEVQKQKETIKKHEKQEAAQEPLYEKYGQLCYSGKFGLHFIDFLSLPKDANSLAPIDWIKELKKYDINLANIDNNYDRTGNAYSWKYGYIRIATYRSSCEAQIYLADELHSMPIELFGDSSVGDICFNGRSYMYFVRKNFLIDIGLHDPEASISPKSLNAINNLAQSIDKIILSSKEFLKEVDPYEVSISKKSFNINEEVKVTITPKEQNRDFKIRCQRIKGQELSLDKQFWTPEITKEPLSQSFEFGATKSGNGTIKIYVCEKNGMVWTYYLEFNAFDDYVPVGPSETENLEKSLHELLPINASGIYPKAAKIAEGITGKYLPSQYTEKIKNWLNLVLQTNLKPKQFEKINFVGIRKLHWNINYILCKYSILTKENDIYNNAITEVQADKQSLSISVSSNLLFPPDANCLTNLQLQTYLEKILNIPQKDFDKIAVEKHFTDVSGINVCYGKFRCDWNEKTSDDSKRQWWSYIPFWYIKGKMFVNISTIDWKSEDRPAAAQDTWDF